MSVQKETTDNVRGLQQNTANIPTWLYAIEKHKIPWDNYLDENGKNASNLSINMFQTNFLLDNTGKIIMKNIAPLALEEFLKENLKDQVL